MKDLLIIGGGFAGLSCAMEAINRGLSFDIIDHTYLRASTRIAAGIINPITGRKYQLQEQFDAMSAHAYSAYKKIELLTGRKILHQLPIFKMHKSESALEAWQYACQQHGTPPQVQLLMPVQPWQKHVDYRFGHIVVEGGGRVDAHQLYAAVDDIHKIKSIAFDYAALEIYDDKCVYQSEIYQHVIFCEGYQVTTNPWFNHIHIRPSKGECLLVQIPHLNCPIILQKNMFIVPYGDDRYWVGGTNDFIADDDTPTAIKYDELLDGLRDTIRIPFTVEQQYAAIRPTMRDRRPAVGTHLQHNRLHILNGLGTKGALLGPYHAQMLFNTIFNKQPIDQKVDVRRFGL